MDSSAFNYDSLATIDNGLCCFVTGCTNNLAYNFDLTACYDDGSCVFQSLVVWIMHNEL